MKKLDQTLLLKISPKHKKIPAPFISYFIYLLIWSFWGISLMSVFLYNNLLGWLSGFIYIFYDTSLLIYAKNKVSPILNLTNTNSKTEVLTNKQKVTSPKQVNFNLPKLTIGMVVPARNEEGLILKTVQAILEQTLSLDKILIIDDGSTDATAADLIDHYWLEKTDNKEADLWHSRKYENLYLIKKSQGGKVISLNIALDYLDTDLIITLDADTILAPDAIFAMHKAFLRDKNLVAAAGILTPVCKKSLFSGVLEWFQKYEYIRATISRIAWMRKGTLLLVSGAFAGFRKEALLQVGGFDPSSIVEDYELIHRLYRYANKYKLNWRVKILNEAKAITDAPNNPWVFIKQRQRWFSGFLETQYWNKDMVGNSQFGALGEVMLPIKAIDTLQPVYGLTAFSILIYLLYTGQRIVPIILFIIGFKILIDLFFHIWSVKAYYNITKQPYTGSDITLAVLAAIFEPFTFQLLRHFSAFCGWISFLTRRMKWK